MILYWTTTGLFSIAMLLSAAQYLTSPKMKAAFAHLGFPGYFRIELAIAKILGVGTLLLPVSPTLKEWAYAGFGITLISAFIAHSSKKDPMGMRLAPLAVGVMLALSYYASHG